MSVDLVESRPLSSCDSLSSVLIIFEGRETAEWREENSSKTEEVLMICVDFL